MPSIISAPVRTRRDSRGMTAEQATEYVDLMNQVEDGQIVLVDDSESDGYEKSYAKGERVRTAIKKFELLGDDEKVQVVSFEQSEGVYVAAVRIKA